MTELCGTGGRTGKGTPITMRGKTDLSTKEKGVQAAKARSTVAGRGPLYQSESV